METPLTLTDVEALAARPDGSRLGRVPRRRGRSGADAARERRRVRRVAPAPARPLRHRVGVDRDDTVLGHHVASPVVVAPVAYQRMAHPDGEEGLARAAAAVGSAFCLSTFATASPAEVAAAAPGSTPVPPGLRLSRSRRHRRADRGGDRRRLQRRLPHRRPARGRPARPGAAHPLDVRRRHAAGRPAARSTRARQAKRSSSRPGARLGLPRAPCLVAFRAGRRQGRPRPRGRGPRCRARRRRGSSSRTTAAASSTARCRRSRRCRRSSTRLATGSRCSSTAASGAAPTSSTALALGARAVLAGRMPLWGLAARGEEGAREVLELLREELAVALHLDGLPLRRRPLARVPRSAA